MEGQRLEWVWVGVIVALLTAFLAALAYATTLSINTPYKVQLIDVRNVIKEFRPGVEETPPGSGYYVVNVLAYQWGWMPNEIVLKDPKVIKFRIASRDVIHGFEIVGTNVNVMVFPGYIAEVTWYPPSNFRGTYLIICNEYCGVGHAYMYGKLVIER